MVANLSIEWGGAYESIYKIFRKETPFVIPIVDAIKLMIDFGTFIVVILIGLVITIVKLNTKK